MSKDSFASYQSSLDAPATTTFAITPSDSVVLTNIPRAIYVGVGGDINIQGINDSAPTVFKAVPQGSTLPVRAKLVYATSTTATNLVGLY